MPAKLKIFIQLLVMSALMIGCGTSGTRALRDETQSSISEKLQEGVTTKAEVYAMLGDPLSVSLTESGLEILTYEFVRFTPKARNFIPYNVFSVGNDENKKVLVVLLNEDGTVRKVILSESEGETKSGLLE
jgi:outer membrane protein assembly factor BamE (lipoprotein component of BamABCDE complex)